MLRAIAAVVAPASRRAKNASARASARAFLRSQARGQAWPQVWVSPSVTACLSFTQVRPQSHLARTRRFRPWPPGSFLASDAKATKEAAGDEDGASGLFAACRGASFVEAPQAGGRAASGAWALVGGERNRPRPGRQRETPPAPVVPAKGSAADTVPSAPAPARVGETAITPGQGARSSVGGRHAYAAGVAAPPVVRSTPNPLVPAAVPPQGGPMPDPDEPQFTCLVAGDARLSRTVDYSFFRATLTGFPGDRLPPSVRIVTVWGATGTADLAERYVRLRRLWCKSVWRSVGDLLEQLPVDAVVVFDGGDGDAASAEMIGLATAKGCCGWSTCGGWWRAGGDGRPAGYEQADRARVVGVGAAPAGRWPRRAAAAWSWRSAGGGPAARVVDARAILVGRR